MKIFISKEIPQIGISYLENQGYQVDIWKLKREISPTELIYKSKDYDAFITMLSDQLDHDFFKACFKKLKVISNFAVGVNNIDLKSATLHKIPIGHTPEILTQATAELTLALLMNVARKIPQSITQVHTGNFSGFDPLNLLGVQLQNKTIGIIGAGRIGQAFASICHFGLKMKVLYWGKNQKHDFENTLKAEFIPKLDDILKKSDIISIHCPLVNETRSLLNYNKLKMMKENAILLNTARGEIIDEGALYKILNERHLFGVGVDVSSPEPMNIHNPLLKLPRFIITSHIGSATESAREEMSLLCAKNITLAFKEEKLLKCANPEVYQQF